MSALGRLSRRLRRPRTAPDRERKLRFLSEAGADRVEHSDERLLDHLTATGDLLASWGARPALCDAALFHSVYGTEFFSDEILGPERRSEVRALIGDEAELLAWFWHAVHRESLADNLGREDDLRIELRDGGTEHLSRRQFEDLVNLMIADAVEQMPRREVENADHQQRWLSPFLATAMPEAATAARESFGRYASPGAGGAQPA